MKARQLELPLEPNRDYIKARRWWRLMIDGIEVLDYRALKDREEVILRVLNQRYPMVPNVLAAGLEQVRARLAEVQAPQHQGLPRGREFTMPLDGTYTLEGPDGHVTLQLGPVTFGDFAEGTKLVKYLAGPDNEADFQGFAFVTPHGQVQIWGRKRGRVDKQERALRALLASTKAERARYGYDYSLQSNRCWRCNRTLTVPASIHRGLGPVCAARLGLS